MISNSLLAEEPLFCFIPGFKTWPEIEALPCKQDISTGETSQGIIMKNSIKLDIKCGEALEFEGRTEKNSQANGSLTEENHQWSWRPDKS